MNEPIFPGSKYTPNPIPSSFLIPDFATLNCTGGQGKPKPE